MKIIGVTKCPTGIAHTYMAAERLEITGEKLGYEMHIETQGSQGTENMLTARQIAEADYVIIAADVAIEGIERFRGKKIYRISIKPVLKDTRQVFLDMEAKAEKMGETAGDDEKEAGETSSAAPVSCAGSSSRTAPLSTSIMVLERKYLSCAWKKRSGKCRMQSSCSFSFME